MYTSASLIGSGSNCNMSRRPVSDDCVRLVLRTVSCCAQPAQLGPHSDEGKHARLEAEHTQRKRERARLTLSLNHGGHNGSKDSRFKEHVGRVVRSSSWIERKREKARARVRGQAWGENKTLEIIGERYIRVSTSSALTCVDVVK